MASVDEHGLPITSQATLPRNGIPSYLATQLVSLLPQTVGTCIHYPLVSEGEARVLNLEALVAVAEEELEVNGHTINAIRWERRSVDTPAATTIWTDPTTALIVQAEYGGGAMSQVSNYDSMLADGQKDGLLTPILMLDHHVESLEEAVSKLADRADALIAQQTTNAGASSDDLHALYQDMCALTLSHELTGISQETIQAAIDPFGERIGAALSLLPDESSE